MIQESEELWIALGNLLVEYRRIRIAYLTNVQDVVKPPSWEVEKKVLLLLEQGTEESLEFQKNKF